MRRRPGALARPGTRCIVEPPGPSSARFTRPAPSRYCGTAPGRVIVPSSGGSPCLAVREANLADSGLFRSKPVSRPTDWPEGKPIGRHAVPDCRPVVEIFANVQVLRHHRVDRVWPGENGLTTRHTCARGHYGRRLMQKCPWSPRQCAHGAVQTGLRTCGSLGFGRQGLVAQALQTPGQVGGHEGHGEGEPRDN